MRHADANKLPAVRNIHQTTDTLAIHHLPI